MNENKNINPNPPHTGEVRNGFSIGYNNFGRYIWQACARCGIERWVKLNKGKPVATLCKECWYETPKHKVRLDPEYACSNGYTMAKVPEDSICKGMGNRDGYMLKQRLVMAEFLGRPLMPHERVYFKDSNPNNFDIDNLRLLGCAGEYNIKLEKDCIELKKIVKEQHAQIIFLSSIIVLLKQASKNWFKLIYEDVDKTP